MKTTSALYCLCLTFVACTQDAAGSRDGWELDGEDMTGLPGERDDSGSVDLVKSEDLSGFKLDFEPCNEDFAFGPAWLSIPDKKAASEESQWIAVLRTKVHYKNIGDKLEEVDQIEGEQFSRLLEKSDVEVILYEESTFGRFIVRGAPQSILSLAKESCFVLGVDLTGFNCDCAPEQCDMASYCRLYANPVEEQFDSSMKETSWSKVWISYEPVLTCYDDVVTEYGEYVITQVTDSRGVRWGVHGLQPRVLSWEQCMNQQN